MTEAAAALGIAPRTLRLHCQIGNVIGAERIGEPGRGMWVIPVDADGRPRMRKPGKLGRPRKWKP